KDGEIYIATFKLIEDDYPKLDVFIELDNDAKNVWQKYTALENIANRFERKTAFDKIKSEFYKYVISIPKNTENNPPQYKDGELHYAHSAILDNHYDSVTGYITKTKAVIIF
ncbi:CRISPR-associated protein Cas3, partial [Candidatus Magnetoovum chiemensis]